MNSKTFVDVCGEKYNLRNALVSGLDEKDGSPVTLYSGNLDIDEIYTLFYYANRTIIKMLVNHFDIPLENADSFLVSAMTEALMKEYKISIGKEPDTDHQKVIRYEKGKN
jgi:hypothetical protein